MLRSFDPLLEADCFLGFQSVEEIPGWVNNAVMGARAGHPFLEQCMDHTLAFFRERGEFELSPRVTTRVLKMLGLRAYGEQSVSGIHLHPVETFYPFSWTESFSPSCLKPNTVAVHHWNHSWASEPK